jgi:hypothetical protein
MTNPNQDLLDLCRLNRMEEHIQGSPAIDAKSTLQAIDWKKRELAIKLTQPTSAPAPVVESEERKLP